MNHRLTLLPLFASLAIGLSACSKTETTAAPAAAVATSATQTYELVAAGARGFTVGPLMSAYTVYVLFDPQCPHCGHLWEAARPLLNKVKFVWVPVAIINGNSTSQGAALLTAANPLETMTAHETSLLARTGGLATQGSVAPEIEAALKKNTQIFNDLRLESVPFIVAKNAANGQFVTHSGAMDTPSLVQFLGLNAAP
jgi:thiol:disulfide interchange protein DsbG